MKSLIFMALVPVIGTQVVGVLISRKSRELLSAGDRQEAKAVSALPRNVESGLFLLLFIGYIGWTRMPEAPLTWAGPAFFAAMAALGIGTGIMEFRKFQAKFTDRGFLILKWTEKVALPVLGIGSMAAILWLGTLFRIG